MAWGGAWGGVPGEVCGAVRWEVRWAVRGEWRGEVRGELCVGRCAWGGAWGGVCGFDGDDRLKAVEQTPCRVWVLRELACSQAVSCVHTCWVVVFMWVLGAAAGYECNDLPVGFPRRTRFLIVQR